MTDPKPLVAHLVCGVRAPVPALADSLVSFGRTEIVALSIAFGAIFGIAALLLIETMRGLEKGLRRFEGHPYRVAAAGGLFLAVFYWLAGPQYAGLGTDTIEAALSGATQIAVAAFVWKIVATAVTLETGGSGGIVTPLFREGSLTRRVLRRPPPRQPGTPEL